MRLLGRRQHDVVGFPLAVGLLALIVLLPRWVMLEQAVAPAKDAVRYWSAADQFVLGSPTDAVRRIPCLPVYPWMLAQLKMWGWGATGEAWWRSSQWSSLFFYTWFLVSAYVAGRSVFPERWAWWGCVLVSCLPRQARYSIDVLSDPLAGALVMTSIAMVLGQRVPRSGWRKWLGLFGAGCFAGLAALTRVETLLWPIAMLAFHLVEPFLTRPPRGWRDSSLAALVFFGPVAVLMASFTAVRGEWTLANTGRAVLGGATLVERAGDTPPEPKTPVDLLMPTSSEGLGSHASAVGASTLRVFWEYFQETRVWLGLLAVAGIVVLVRSSDRRREWLLVGILVVLWFMMLVVCRWKAGYVSGRYFLPILPWVGMLGSAALARGIGRAGGRWPAVVAATVGVVVLSGADAMLRPLHADRSAHREAADWLVQHTAPGEFVYDPSWVSTFFAGRPPAAEVSGPGTPVRYAVVDESLLERPLEGMERSLPTLRAGRVVATFISRSGKGRVRIVDVSPSGHWGDHRVENRSRAPRERRVPYSNGG